MLENFLYAVFDHGVFHSDLHPANLLILPDNTVGYVDFAGNMDTCIALRTMVVKDGIVHVFFRRDPNDPNKAIRVEADMGVDDVLIQVEACGICGSDLEIYDGRFTQTTPPLIIDHEGGGIVEAPARGTAVAAEVREHELAERPLHDAVLYRCRPANPERVSRYTRWLGATLRWPA